MALTRILLLLPMALTALNCPKETPPPPVKATCAEYSAKDCAAATPTSGKKCLKVAGVCQDAPDVRATCAEYPVAECVPGVTAANGKNCIAVAGACQDAPTVRATCAEYPVPECVPGVFAGSGKRCLVGASGQCEDAPEGPDPDDGCTGKPLFPVKLGEAYTDAEIAKVEQQVLGQLAGFFGALADKEKFDRITETVKLITLIARNENEIMNKASTTFWPKSSYDNFILGLRAFIGQKMIDSNVLIEPTFDPTAGTPPLYDKPSLVGLPANLPDSFDKVRETLLIPIRQGMHNLVVAANYFAAKKNVGWRDFFESAFDKGWGCMAVRNASLQNWVDTRVNNFPHTAVVYSILTSYNKPTDPPNFKYVIIKLGIPQAPESNVARLARYYVNSVVLRQFFENPSFEKTPYTTLQKQPAFKSEVTVQKAATWIQDSVRDAWTAEGKANLFLASDYNNLGKIQAEILNTGSL